MIISLLIILLISTVIGLYFEKDTVECLPFSVFGIIFILYLFGIFKLLFLGVLIIYAISLGSIVFILYQILSKKKKLNDIIPINLLFFCGLVIFLYTILNGSKIICYDEFTAWGLFSKSMFESKNLYIYTEFPILAKNYQSATAIFQFFVNEVNGTFSETLLLSAMNILFFAMTSVVLRNLKIKRLFEIITRSVLIFMVPLSLYMWPAVYYTILVDVILGVAFAYIIYYYFFSPFDKFTFLNLSLAMFFLTCSKGNGLVLAVLLICMIYFDIIVFKFRQLKKHLLDNRKFTLSNINYKKLVIVLSPIIICGFTYLSWFLCLKILNINSYEVNSLTSSIFSSSFKTNFVSYIGVAKGIFTEYYYYIIGIVTLGYMILMFNFREINKKVLIRNVVSIFVYLACIIAYTLFLFVVCNTMVSLFIATEALRRYLFTLVVANIILISFGLIYVCDKRKVFGITFILVIITWFLTPAERQYKEFISEQYTRQSIEYREQFEPIKEIVNKVDVKKDIVYFLGKDEIDPLIANFVVFPLSISNFPLWTDDLTYNEYYDYLKTKPNINLYRINTDLEKDAVNRKLDGEVYIYIYKFDDYFDQKYTSFFADDIENNTLYKIYMDNGTIRFVKR